MTQDQGVQHDRFTSSVRPPQVIDHRGQGWSAVPHGVLNPHERYMATCGVDGVPEALNGDHTVSLQEHQDQTVRLRRLTPLGAETLGQQLIDAAQEARVGLIEPHDAELEDYVTAGQRRVPGAGKNVERELAESITVPDAPDGVPVVTTPDGEVRQMKARLRDDHPRGRSLLRKDGDPEWSDATADAAQPSLGQLIVMAESFLTQNHGVLAMVHHPGEDWIVTVTFGEETPGSEMAAGQAIGTGTSAADALREALAQVGEDL